MQFVVAVLVAALLPLALAGGTWHTVGTRQYYVSDNTNTWSGAASTCRGMSAYLVTITSSSEQNTVASLANKREVWIGLYTTVAHVNRYAPNEWRWHDGSSFSSSSYSKWFPEEPNDCDFDEGQQRCTGNVGGENCVGFYHFSNDDRWNDDPCGKGNYFICERAAPSYPIATPPTISNGVNPPSVSSQTYPSTATYTCNTGFTSNSLSISCYISGSVCAWPAAPTCNRVNCGNPQGLSYGTYSLTTGSTLYQAQAVYSCNTGYEPSTSSRTITCQANGAWSSTSVKCNPVSCGNPSNNANCQVTTTKTTYQGVATYVCATGYRTSDVTTRTCQANKAWSGSAPVCSPVSCGSPPSNPGGSFVMNYNTYGGTVTYSCPIGYDLQGPTQRTCQSNGQWSQATTVSQCNIVSCPTLTLANGLVQASGLTYGASVLLTCNTGYVPSDTFVRKCQADKTWSGTSPTCSPVSCGTPSAVSKATVQVFGTVYQSTAKYTCATGYEMSGSSVRTCGADGQWSAAPTCTIVSCPALSHPTHGTVSTPQGTQYQDAAGYSCNFGYYINGQSTRVCQANKQWSGIAPTCEIVTCENLNHPENGQVIVPNNQHQSTAEHTCNDGYELQGSATRVCQADGTWSGDQVKCIPVDCLQPPTIDNGSRQFSTTTFQSTVTYSCKIGYNLVGSSTATCNKDREWSPAAPFCRIVTCPQLSSVDNGDLQVSSLDYQGTATITCDSGFEPAGPAERVCSDNGQWKPNTAQTCQRVSCGQLSSVSNGEIELSGTLFEDVATYSCDAGYELKGDVSRQCLATKQWSGTAPTCAGVACAPLDELANGQITAGTHFPATATAECNEGYELVDDESAVRQCLTTGVWSGEPAECVGVSCPTLVPPANGHIPNGGADFVFPETVTVTCEPGYQIDGSATLSCLSSGDWDNSVPKCTGVPCDELTPIDNGSIQAGESFPTDAVYECDPGYELVGSALRSCGTDGHWSGSAPSCKPIECVPPNGVEHGSLEISSPVFPSTATYTCEEGYELQGTSVRTCQPDGTWSDPDPNRRCRGVACPLPASPDNGFVDYINHNDQGRYPASVQYHCVEGYLLTGIDVRDCQTDGSWTGTGPTCEQCETPCELGQFLQLQCQQGEGCVPCEASKDHCKPCSPCPTGLTSRGGCFDTVDTYCMDVDPPVITLIGDAEIPVEVGAVFNDPGATALDSYDGEVEVVRGGDEVDTSKLGSYRVSYNAVDKAGNPAFEVFRTVIVEDTTDPEIVIIGSTRVEVDALSEYNDLGAQATDNVDGDITSSIHATGLPVDTSTVGEKTVIYFVSDSSGNSATAVRTVVVVDGVKPEFDDFDAEIEVQGGSDFEPSPPSASDAVDGDLSGEVVTSVALVEFGEYVGAGPCAAGFRPLFKNSFEQDPVEYKFNGVVDSSAPVDTEYTITFTVEDESGNSAEVHQTATIVDTLKPSVSVSGGASLNIDYGNRDQTVFERFASAVASDQHLGIITHAICVRVTRTKPSNSGVGDDQLDDNDESFADPSLPLSVIHSRRPLGTVFKIEYQVTDSVGLTDTFTRIVTVKDLSGPEVTLAGSELFYVPYGTRFEDPGARAKDVHDGPTDVTVEGADSIEVLIPSEYHVVYSSVDAAGNVGTKTRTVVVEPLEIPPLRYQAVIELDMSISTWNDKKPGLLKAISDALNGAYVFVFHEEEQTTNNNRRSRRHLLAGDKVVVNLGARQYNPPPFAWIEGKRIANLFKKNNKVGTSDVTVVRAYEGDAALTSSNSSASSSIPIAAGVISGLLLILLVAFFIHKRKKTARSFREPAIPTYTNPLYAGDKGTISMVNGSRNALFAGPAGYLEPGSDTGYSEVEGFGQFGMYEEPAYGFAEDPDYDMATGFGDGSYAEPSGKGKGHDYAQVHGRAGAGYAQPNRRGSNPYEQALPGSASDESPYESAYSAASAPENVVYDIAGTLITRDGDYAEPALMGASPYAEPAFSGFNPYDLAAGPTAGSKRGVQYDLANSGSGSGGNVVYDIAGMLVGNTPNGEPAYDFGRSGSAGVDIDTDTDGLYDQADGTSDHPYDLAHAGDVADTKKDSKSKPNRGRKGSRSKSKDKGTDKEAAPLMTSAPPDRAYDFANADDASDDATTVYDFASADSVAGKHQQTIVYDHADADADADTDDCDDVTPHAISRQQAERMLKGTGNGTFVLRRKDDGMVISVVKANRVVHYLLQQTASGMELNGKPVPNATTMAEAWRQIPANSKDWIGVQLTCRLNPPASQA